ncbi:hypothetical protein PLICRDRAFT_56795 [Plicaturopsis crispa FD-325 SS-3]|nr:hypothetical protein PLICRDRAFT_56795 [Plicaturopsis crispa FD-325 SS-3]
MSLTDHFLQEFRPFFRGFDDPFARSGRATPSFYAPARSLLEHPFFNRNTNAQSGVDLTEEGDHYIVEAELPGVKKEDLNVTVGDAGRSVTIEGKVFRRNASRGAIEGAQKPAIKEAGEKATPSSGEGASSTPSDEQTQSTFRSSFTRTVWLPQPVAANKVQAKLVDGILTVTIPKAEEPASVRVAVN